MKLNHPERPIISINIMESDDLSNIKDTNKSFNKFSKYISNKNNLQISENISSIHVNNDDSVILNINS